MASRAMFLCSCEQHFNAFKYLCTVGRDKDTADLWREPEEKAMRAHGHRGMKAGNLVAARI